MNRQFMEEKVQVVNKKYVLLNPPNSGMEITPSK